MLSRASCLHSSTAEQVQQEKLKFEHKGKWPVINRDLSGAVWSHLRMIPGLFCNQTSPALSESSVTLIRSDRL